MRTVNPELLAQLNQSASVLQKNLQHTPVDYKTLERNNRTILDNTPIDRPDFTTRYNCKKVNFLPHGNYLVEVLSAKCHNTKNYVFQLKILKLLLCRKPPESKRKLSANIAKN